MAEALLGAVFENLLSLLKNEFATISGIKSKAEKLSTTLELIKAVLEDAEQKQLANRSIKVWLQQLKDAVYVLDDILDECSIESSRLRGFSSFKPKNIMFRREIGNKLKEITARFDQISESKNKFLLRQGDGVNVKERPTEVAEWRQTSSIIVEPIVYGREDDRDKIVEFLLTQARGSDFLSIYPIVGLGGVGKTTLAQLVYNDHKVSKIFDIKLWVCVSEVFSVNRILCSIIESITRQKFDILDLDVIVRKVQELLQGKRYFLVLDDVWNRNQEMESGLSQDKWNKLKSVLSCGSRGTSILVSTRDNDVAEIMGTCQAHHLSGLSENECWLLFKQYAFGNNSEERAELVVIGKEIVKKCGGLPLAAQALGGLMRSRNEEKEWLEIKESNLWSLPDENFILPALRLSYFHLTPTLKQCFSFCAIFPKDTEIMKEDLIHLWIANRFISSRENLEVEDVGNMIWNELCRKSFFQDIKVHSYSGVISFKMHDLVHDLAQSVVGSECVFLENTNNEMSRSTHHIGFNSATILSPNKVVFKKVESLRTLYDLNYHQRTSFCFSSNRSLHVLCISSFNLSSLESLIHLRYLALHDLDMETLPDSICSLRKLEILKVKRCRKLRCLPEHLIRLQNLRHLVIEDNNALSRMFPYIGKLFCLRTLSKYIVRSEPGYGLQELHDLKLRGKLMISDLNNVVSLSEAREANLLGKKDIHELWFSWSGPDETKTPTTSVEQVLEVLQPHSNLKSFHIFQYRGLWFPSWIGTMSSLVSLGLDFCNNCVRLPPLGNLPSLKSLELIEMHNVQYIDDDESVNGAEMRAFSSLETLSLSGLRNLERLLKVERVEMFPCLSNLHITSCPKLELPRLSCAKNLSLIGCNIELLRSISTFYGLTTLYLDGSGNMTTTSMTFFPEGMLRNLNCLQSLKIFFFPQLKELPNELFSLENLEYLHISYCRVLESLPEKNWEGLQSLRTLEIVECPVLRSLPDGIRHLTSLEVLKICHCPVLKEQCEEGTGEDWEKIAHIPKVYIE